MEMCLTGRNMDAAEAERAGSSACVVPAAELLSEAMKAARTIAGALGADRDDDQGDGQSRL